MKRLITYFSTRKALSPENGPTLARLWSEINPFISRKLFVCLFCLLSIGVGQMWAATYTYRLVISKDALTDGGKYILLVNGRGTAYKGTVSSGHLQTGLTFSSSQTSAGSAVTTTNTADKIIYVTLINMSGDKYKILDSNGKYITTTGATSGKFSLADADSYGWTFYGTSGMDAIYEQAFSSKYASMRSYNNATFRSYQAANHTSPSSSGNKIYLATGCTVTYDGNGSTSGTVPEDAYLYGEGHTVTVKSNSGTLAKTGYTFSGWNTRADGTGTNYTAGSGTFTVPSNTTSITLYAKWVSAGTSVSLSKAATSNGSFL